MPFGVVSGAAAFDNFTFKFRPPRSGRRVGHFASRTCDSDIATVATTMPVLLAAVAKVASVAVVHLSGAFLPQIKFARLMQLPPTVPDLQQSTSDGLD